MNGGKILGCIKSEPASMILPKRNTAIQGRHVNKDKTSNEKNCNKLFD